MEKIITKSFSRLLEKAIHRGFVTHDELAKSLGKRHYSQENIEKAFLHILIIRFVLLKKNQIIVPLRKKMLYRLIAAKVQI